MVAIVALAPRIFGNSTEVDRRRISFFGSSDILFEVLTDWCGRSVFDEAGARALVLSLPLSVSGYRDGTHGMVAV